MECINIGPVYIRGWVGGVRGRVGGVRGRVGGGKGLNKSKMTQIVEFRVALMSTCIRKGPIFHYKT